MVLEKIEHENDIKRINKNELPILAEEIRSFLIDKISKTGGHLASNLGVVELTMALHLAFDLPEDKIIWDVGHQSYTHKLLTGRKAGFDELRKYGGMSGFPKRHESDCDCFDTGHSSTSISAGLGYAMAREITGEKYKVISVIGDGALTGGMAYEALNNASKLKSNLIIVLNDNKMSISENVGGVSRYLSGLRTAESYQGLKNGITNSLNSIPKYGERIVEKIRKTKNGIKQLVIPGMLFENMGLTYLGPVDGHNMRQMMRLFNEAKRVDLAKGCEGVKRTTGQHPGGIVVVPLDMDVHDFTPVQYPANNPNATWKTTHFDFHQIHDNILKFDILGHVDPTAMKMLERITGVNVRQIPMNDQATMAIFSTTESLKIDTTKYNEVTGAAGIPEFGTPFVRGILELTKPTTFAELVTISGLSHGTDVWLGNAKDLIDNGTCKLNEVIGCRDDIMVDLMGYGVKPKLSFTIMESVRKGKGLKDEWVTEMKANNVPEWFIDSCTKIKYMFPKAHAVAYVMMAVRIAWFKVHMPVHYYCMYFSIRCDAYDVQTMIQGEAAIRQRMADIKHMKEDKTQKPSDKELAIYDTLELALEMVLRGFRFSNISINRSAATEFIVDPDDPKAIIPPFTRKMY